MRAIAALVVASACSMTATQQNTWVHEPDYYSITADGSRSPRYSRIGEYTAFGAEGLGARARIIDAYAVAQHAAPPASDAVLFHAELPPGIAIDGRTVTVDPRAAFEPIGQYRLEYHLAAAPQDTEIVDDLHRLAKVTGADAIVVEVRHVGSADARVKQLGGFALRRRAVTAAAPRPARKTAQLDYRASDGCPTSDDVGAAIAKQLGYVPWDRNAPSTLHVDVMAIDRGYAASVRLGEGAPRRLSGTTCKRVTDALVSVIVIQLD